MNTYAIGLLIVGVAVSNCIAETVSASSGASSGSNGHGGTYTQTSGPHGTFTTVNGDGTQFAPFQGQPAYNLPGPFFQIPQFQPAPLITPVDFNQALQQYLNSIQRQYAAGGSYTFATPGASVSATTYLGPTNDLYRQQQQLIEQWRDSQLNQFQNSYGHPAYQSGGVGASSSATYGSSGVHQTASLYPENPAKPNLDSRFGDDRPAAPNAGSYYGIGTSSFSQSANVDGKETHKHGAITTVNDNGKVTTYRLGD